MDVLVTIKVYSPSWLELSKEDKEYFKHLKEPDDLEIQMYKESLSFKFTFDVLEYTVNGSAKYDFDLVPGTSDKQYATIENLTTIEFVGAKETSKVLISNDLIWGNFQAKKSGSKLYYYIYLNGNIEYQIVKENVWLSTNAINESKIN